MSNSPWIVPNRINGLDLCDIQDVTPINTKKLVDAGFDFVYVKSSQYSRIKNARYDSLVERLKDAGLKVGAYHFCSHDTDPVKQVQFFHRACGGLGSKPGELPPMLDWEYCTPRNYTPHPDHCVKWIETAAAEATRLWYPDNAYRVVPRYPVVYTYPNYSSSHQPALQASQVGMYPLCYASYSSNYLKLPPEDHVSYHRVPLPWLQPRLTQYSGDKGVPVPGIAGACDRQLFIGSSGDWAEFLGLERPVHITEGNVVENEYQRAA